VNTMTILARSSRCARGFVGTSVVAFLGVALLYEISTGTAGVSQAPVVKENQQFIVNRPAVIPLDTIAVAIVPNLSATRYGPSRVRWSDRIGVPAGRSPISIHFRRMGNSKTPWQLQFQAVGSCRGICEDSIDSSSPRGKAVEAWSANIDASAVNVKLTADTSPDGMTLTIDQYDYRVVPTIPQSEWGAPNYENIYATPTDIQKLGTSVARLRIKTSGGEALCSGFLVSDNLLITNYHCIATSAEAVSSQAEFGVDRMGDKGVVFRVNSLEVANSNLAYDYVVVRLMGAPGKTFGHIKLPAVGSWPLPNKSPSIGSLSFGANPRKLLIIEHPGGGIKKVSRDEDCLVIDDKIDGVDPDILSDFGHRCDTLGGSSGSPVFSRSADELVGLHHLGFVKGQAPRDRLQNQAVYIGYIMNDIAMQSPAIFSEMIGRQTTQ
jgi:hypothetical protein